MLCSFLPVGPRSCGELPVGGVDVAGRGWDGDNRREVNANGAARACSRIGCASLRRHFAVRSCPPSGTHALDRVRVAVESVTETMARSVSARAREPLVRSLVAMHGPRGRLTA
jgi:hypothetical protein